MADNYRILAGSQLIDSLRYGGFKNPAYAIAELIDNSVEANAKHIEILCLNEKFYNPGRVNIKQIAILDDGDGMNEENLRISLKFGDGTRSKTGGIGRFGMGLPNSSFSQCRRVDVFTWKNSIEKTLHCYLDLDEIHNGMDDVPKPKHKKIPSIWINAAKHLSKKSGTLVIWSQLDRCTWKTSSPLFKHSKFLIGRIYRKFLYKKKLLIRLASFNNNNNIVEDLKEEFMDPNDPLYLMIPSSAPKPYDQKQMFKKYGDVWERNIKVLYNKKKYEITARFSIVNNETRPEDQAGSLEHGRHARNNIGISLIRADRELDMDTNLVLQSDTRERWWGAEIDFPTSLDEFFGITNNKQSTVIFSDVAKNLSDVTHNEKSQQQMIQEMKDDGDVIRAEMAEFIININSTLEKMREQIKESMKDIRKSKKNRRHKKPEDKAAKKRLEGGHIGQSDIQEEIPIEKRIENAKQDYMKRGHSEHEASKLAKELIMYGGKFVWETASLSGYQFFDLVIKDGQIHVILNDKHAAHKNLMEIVSENLEDLDIKTALARLERAHDGIKLLLASWARYEDETQNNTHKQAIQQFRIDWGVVLNKFLEYNS